MTSKQTEVQKHFINCGTGEFLIKYTLKPDEYKVTKMISKRALGGSMGIIEVNLTCLPCTLVQVIAEKNVSSYSQKCV